MASWWNASYLIRRQLQIEPSSGLPLLAGYPVYVSLDYAAILDGGVVRADFGDIEIVYNDPNSDTSTVVGKSSVIQDSNLIVQFNLLYDVTATDTNYWIYYTNPQLNNTPVDPPYTPADYAIDTQTTSLGLTFTKPTEYWIDNVSQLAGARAAFTFVGKNVRLVVEKGPDKGIFLLSVDNTTPVTIDTYSDSSTNAIVYTADSLSVDQHYLRINATGDKNPSSSDFKVHIVSFQYSQYTPADALVEEINPSLTPIRIMVGP